MLRSISTLVLSLVAGCGGGPTSDPEDVRAEEEDRGSGQERPTPAAPSRALGIAATFGDLVTAAQQLEEAGAADSSAGCLLGGAGPYRLDADLAVAIRPLPEAPEDLDTQLEGAARASLLSRWGQIGTSDPMLAVFTTAPPPTRGGVAVAATDRGIYVLPLGPAGGSGRGAAIATAEAAAAAIPAGTGLVVVTAERALPLSRLRDLLRAVAGRGASIALAVALPDGVRLPETTRPADDGTGLCTDGLPPLAEEAAGELSPQAIVGALGPLRDGARSCLEAARGEAAAGGRVAIAMRIGPTGILTDACLTEDAIGDRELRACLVRAARAVAFPAPDPPGSVDAVLPLELRPEDPGELRPLCD